MYKKVPKGHYVAKMGEVNPCLPLLISGVFRGVLMDESGHELTDCFAFCPGDAIIGCCNFGEPSPVSFEALTECELLLIPMGVILSLMSRYPEMMKICNAALTEALRRHWQIKRMLYQTAGDRYKWFLNAYPDLIDVVSNKQIASFLGITPVSLSRLRRQLREQSTGR